MPRGKYECSAQVYVWYFLQNAVRVLINKLSKHLISKTFHFSHRAHRSACIKQHNQSVLTSIKSGWMRFKRAGCCLPLWRNKQFFKKKFDKKKKISVFQRILSILYSSNALLVYSIHKFDQTDCYCNQYLYTLFSSILYHNCFFAQPETWELY